MEKNEKLIANLHNKKIICYKKFKQALNHGKVLKTNNRFINFNLELWLGLHTYEQRATKNTKMILKKIFSSQ